MMYLETMITRAKNMMLHGMPTNTIAREFMTSGLDHGLIYWAIRGAKFEIDYEQGNLVPDGVTKVEK